MITTDGIVQPKHPLPLHLYVNVIKSLVRGQCINIIEVLRGCLIKVRAVLAL